MAAAVDRPNAIMKKIQGVASTPPFRLWKILIVTAKQAPEKAKIVIS
jgi:hypothetical protein